jgi:hypothetical protein
MLGDPVAIASHTAARMKVSVVDVRSKFDLTTEEGKRACFFASLADLLRLGIGMPSYWLSGREVYITGIGKGVAGTYGWDLTGGVQYDTPGASTYGATSAYVTLTGWGVPADKARLFIRDLVGGSRGVLAGGSSPDGINLHDRGKLNPYYLNPDSLVSSYANVGALAVGVAGLVAQDNKPLADYLDVMLDAKQIESYIDNSFEKKFNTDSEPIADLLDFFDAPGMALPLSYVKSLTEAQIVDFLGGTPGVPGWGLEVTIAPAVDSLAARANLRSETAREIVEDLYQMAGVLPSRVPGLSISAINEYLLATKWVLWPDPGSPEWLRGISDEGVIARLIQERTGVGVTEDDVDQFEALMSMEDRLSYEAIYSFTADAVRAWQQALLAARFAAGVAGFRQRVVTRWNTVRAQMGGAGELNERTIAEEIEDFRDARIGADSGAKSAEEATRVARGIAASGDDGAVGALLVAEDASRRARGDVDVIDLVIDAAGRSDWNFNPGA